MTPRSPGGRSTVGAEGNSRVGRHKLGNSRRLPGRVVYRCPVGAVQMTVPSGSCSSRQPFVPPQNVLSSWWHRLRELLSDSLARSVNLRLGLLTPQPLPSSAPRIGEGEEHVFNYLLITRHPSEVELLCGITRPKHRYGSRVRHMSDGWPGRFREDAPCASSCGTTSATVTACGVRLVHFARHRASTAAAIVVDWWLDQRRWHRQRWLRPECVEIFALSRPQPPPEEYLNET